MLERVKMVFFNPSELFPFLFEHHLTSKHAHKFGPLTLQSWQWP